MAYSTKQKYGNAKGRLTRARDFVENIVETTPLELLEIRLQNLNDTWTEFSGFFHQILETANDVETLAYETEFSEYETRFFEANYKLMAAIRKIKSNEIDKPIPPVSVVEQLAQQQSSFLEKFNATSDDSPIQLPKFTVPIFSGDYKDWPSFRDSFMGSVDNRKNLTATQKFHYLKSFLRDEAANLVKHITVSDANYMEAWERLERRYDRVHLIVQSFIQTFLSLPSASSGNARSLRKLTDGADEVVRGLNALGSNERDPWLVFLLLGKVDEDSKQSWAEHAGSSECTNFSALLTFLQARCDAFESCQSITRPIQPRKSQTQFRANFAETPRVSPQCSKCAETHYLHQCPQFAALDIESRRSFVKNKSLCFNCLRVGHASAKCKSTHRCRQCQSRHHSLVHPIDQTNLSNSQSSSQSSSQTTRVYPQSTRASTETIAPTTLNNQPARSSSSQLSPFVINHSVDIGLGKQTILPTILARVQDKQGIFVSCRVLLDTGSQVSFLSEAFAQRLGIPRKQARVPILGVSSAEAGHTRGCISIKLYSRFDETTLFVEAFVLSKLTSSLPSQSFDASQLSHLQDLELADPSFNLQGPIDVLLGADRCWCILKNGQIRGSEGLPVAQNTTFGWVVTGELLNNSPSNTTPISSLHSSVNVDSLLQRFWEMEEVCPPSADLDNNDELHFRKTFSRSSDGRYVVQLPFIKPSPNFANSLKSAVGCLLSIERRFQSNSTLREMYIAFMQEYLQLGHMVRIPSNEIEANPAKCFYLPHHAVLKPESSTTKLRVVFNGSATDSNGVSLNSQMSVGPLITRNLFDVILRFREKRYVFTADVVKMYRQIWVDNIHTDYQRIVWRENPSEQIGHYRLLTLTYGTKPAAALSDRVLVQIANDYRTDYPTAARVVLEDRFVDDIMTGADSSEDLISLQTELVSLLSNASLELRKWSSNCWPLLARLPSDECEFSLFDTERSNLCVKVLGMHWSPTSDDFSFKMTKSRLCANPTRRTLLSEISRIFDPLGFLAPSIVLFKILFQKLWSSELTLRWDDPLPAYLADTWTNYQREIQCFEQISIPRHVYVPSEEVELHGFSDASTLAYAAVVFARCRISESTFKVVIVAAKSKVAPLKPVSVPRLELCGALLLCRLINAIKSSLRCTFKVFAWCDSQIVLHWLSSPPRRWTTFVANRTAAILDEIPRYAWNHIESDSNPADCASRGVLPSNLKHHPLWWSGPAWLSKPQQFWPISKASVTRQDEDVLLTEERPTPKQALISSTERDSVKDLIEKTSSWTRLLRIVAYCFRVASNSRPGRADKIVTGITFREIRIATIHILKLVQTQGFGDDIHYLLKNRTLPTKSKLLRYSPFIDADGLLRVGGRIKHANVAFNIKHPILLPNNNHVSLIIAEDIHKSHLHTGVSETFAILRQRYWILGSRQLIRKIVSNCKICFMQRTSTSSQLMGDLPVPRVQPSRPFTNTGCDYAGPITIKLSRGRNPKTSKAYIALFVCMSTKAVHIELVSDLTTEAFLAAFRRFISRRGKCSNVYSDNGTNFHGARRCLDEMQQLTLSQGHNDQVAAALAMDGTIWHFIPPSAPHFGGLWEAGVKSVKWHLRRVVGASILTFEELYTVLSQIEAILNSRPICLISDDDLNPLTPAHFLIGEPYTAVPEPSYADIPPNRLNHWQFLQSMVQGFWRRWHVEYITALQERPKWQASKSNINVGDIVVIREPNLPTAKWLLGRVEIVHPGADNRVRVATVKTIRGSLVRAITKLAKLPWCPETSPGGAHQNTVDVHDSPDDTNVLEPNVILETTSCHSEKMSEKLGRKTNKKREAELMKRCGDISKTSTDEDQIFGDYVASVLRSLPNKKSHKRVRLMIQRSILEVQEI